MTVEVIRRLLDEVKPERTKFALETMLWTIPDSPDAYLKLMQAVNRPGFAVHMDPANFITSVRKYYENGAVIREAFDKLGPWIVSCHAKDLSMRPDMGLHIDEVVPGSGFLDYRVFLKELDKLDRDIPLMIEHLESDAEYAAARDNILAVADETGAEILK